jgi:hypothetical protein
VVFACHFGTSCLIPDVFDELSDLYQHVILDHCKQPRNFHELSGATRSAQGRNPETARIAGAGPTKSGQQKGVVL